MLVYFDIKLERLKDLNVIKAYPSFALVWRKFVAYYFCEIKEILAFLPQYSKM